MAASILSLLGFFGTLVLVLEFSYPNLERTGMGGLHPIILALAFCLLFGMVAGFLWPALWLRLAIVASGAFWGYFALVFAFLLLEGVVDLVPLGQAGLAMMAAVVGAWLGQATSPRSGNKRRRPISAGDIAG
jgi:hypothetical protein